MIISNRQFRAKKFVSLLFSAVGGYLLGSYIQAEYAFPMKAISEIWYSLFDEFVRDYVPSEKPRNTIFKAFSPTADVVMIGDSITAGGEWREIFPGVLVANRGIAGDRTDDILARLDQILSVKPRKAFIMAGINDISQGRQINKIMSDFSGIVSRLVRARVTVFIQSTLECSRHICGRRLDMVRELNKRLKKYASESGVTYININQRLTTEKEGLRPEFTYDGVHLLGAGYIEWSGTISSYINFEQEG